MKHLLWLLLLLPFMFTCETEMLPGSEHNYWHTPEAEYALSLHRIHTDASKLNQYYPNTPELIEAIYDASVTFEIPYRLIIALIFMESSFNPYAVSYADCVGLMQINPAVHTWFDAERQFEVRYNIMSGGRILRKYYDCTGDWEQALIRYNGYYRTSKFGETVLNFKTRLK